MRLSDHKLNVMEFAPGRYYLAIWFMNIPPAVSEFGQGGDILALVWRFDTNPNEWVLQFRFRHYADNKVWGSKDTRHWRAGQLAGAEAEALESARRALSTISAVACRELHELEIHGDRDAADRIFREKKPFWFHSGVSDELAARGGKPGGN